MHAVRWTYRSWIWVPQVSIKSTFPGCAYGPDIKILFLLIMFPLKLTFLICCDLWFTVLWGFMTFPH